MSQLHKKSKRKAHVVPVILDLYDGATFLHKFGYVGSEEACLATHTVQIIGANISRVTALEPLGLKQKAKSSPAHYK